MDLFSSSAYPGDGVFCHPQVVEDEARPEAECAHHLGEGLRRFLEGLEDAHRETAEARDVFRTEAGPDATAILIVVPVEDVMDAFDAPVAAVDGQDSLRRGLVRGATRDPQRNLTRVLAGLFLDGFTLNQKDLPDVREVEIRIERRTAPDASRFDAAVIGRRDLDEVGGAARLKQQRDIALQRRVVALDGEIIVRLPLDEIACQCTLGQQGIAGDILAGEGTALQQRDGHADFVGALLLLTTRYGQGPDFFWV